MFLGLRTNSKIDWWLVGGILPIIVAGLATMHSFTSQTDSFNKQLVWLTISFVFMVVASFIDWRFLKRTDVVVGLYVLSCVVLLALFFFGKEVNGAKSWFQFGGVSIQPSDFAKLILIIVLAKYFSRRHVEIAHFRHIIVSGIYAFIIFALILLQPDFGSAVIIFSIWFGLVWLSGISKKHFVLLILGSILTTLFFWNFVFAPYQKARIVNFIHPLTDLQGSGYNAFQSMVAVGSGGIFGKGVGFGTQSRLKFLPEHETDFIFAAFAEEWGFFGALTLFVFFSFVLIRITKNALRGASNFEILFGFGLAVYFLSHFMINVGMNIGLFPVTGITLPFMSYGGSHLLSEFVGLGILMGMRRYGKSVHKDDLEKSFLDNA